MTNILKLSDDVHVEQKCLNSGKIEYNITITTEELLELTSENNFSVLENFDKHLLPARYKTLSFLSKFKSLKLNDKNFVLLSNADINIVSRCFEAVFFTDDYGLLDPITIQIRV